MKSFHLTVWGVIILFALVMGCVAVESFSRKTHAYKLDLSQVPNRVERDLSQK